MIKAFNFNKKEKDELQLFYSIKKFDHISVDNIVDCIGHNGNL